MWMEVERGRSTLVRCCSSYFDRICDELVVEILNRLPIKAVHRCKSVCKRWCDLISTHHFIKSYIIRRKKSSNAFCLFYQNTYYLELRSRPPDDNTISLFYATDLTLFQSSGFSLTPPPSSSSMPFFTVLSSSNGLVLCSESLISQTRYHVCNPLTKHWVSTPPPPSTSLKRTHIGFLCKACMDFDTVNNSCGGFVIVRIPNHSQGPRASVLKIEIYDSESGQWAESELDDGWRRDLERHNFHHLFDRKRLTAVVCKGLFHWKGFNRVFIYDHSSSNNNSNNNNKCKTVKLPPLEGPPCTVVDCYLGECKEQLMYTRFQHRIFSVWKLKDDYDINNEGGGEECWRLLHNVPLNQMVSDHPNLIQFLEGPRIDFMFLAFHPFDEDIVFLCYRYRVQSFNMREKTVTNISHVLSAVINVHYSMPYLVVLPWWPGHLSLSRCVA